MTSMNKEAKLRIREKIPESGLMETANHEMLEAILFMEKIVETLGWKLDYEALKLDGPVEQLLNPPAKSYTKAERGESKSTN